MAPYIFMEKNGIHIIDLHKTVAKIDEAAAALKQIAKSGRRVLFVATKKQAKDVVAETVAAVNMPYVTERWPGGMLTNFPTIRKAVKKMATIDKYTADGTYDNFSKREKLQIARQRAKLEKNLRGSVNRRVNCDAANLDKAVDAAMEQIEAIRRLEERMDLTELGEKLYETARLRLENPELTLSQLAELCDPPVTKSCLNHRLRKLVELSKE